jgi:Flp pilus assembly protein TadD
VVGAAALLLALAALVVWQRRRRPQLAVGWLWWGITLLPVIGIVQVGQAALADRYTYLSQSGLVLALAATLAPPARRTRATRIAAAALGLAALVALGLATSAQVRHWRSSETLFEQALRVTQRNHVAHLNLALVQLERGELARAEPHLVEALRLAPASAIGQGLLGKLRLAQGRAPEALQAYERALRIEPASGRWLSGLASAQLALGREADAIPNLERALALEPDSALLHAHLGRALAKQEQWAPALVQLAAAVRLDPTNAEFAALRARLLDRAGRTSEAIAAYREALALGAQAPDLRNNLAWLLATSGLGGPGAANEAVGLAEQAVASLGGNDAGALDTLSVAYAAAGRHEEASRTAAKALVLAEAQGDAALAAEIRNRLAREARPEASGIR